MSEAAVCGFVIDFGCEPIGDIEISTILAFRPVHDLFVDCDLAVRKLRQPAPGVCGELLLQDIPCSARAFWIEDTIPCAVTPGGGYDCGKSGRSSIAKANSHSETPGVWHASVHMLSS